MKITVSFSPGDPADVVEARNFLETLSALDEVSLAARTRSDVPTLPGPPPPAPPPPPGVTSPAPPAPPPPAPPAPPTSAPHQPTTLGDHIRDREAAAADAPQPEVDGAGRPWDERFHVKTKSKIKDGTWRRKRGVSQEEVEAALPSSPSNEAPAGVVPLTPPLAPVPPAANGEVTWENVVQAFQARAQNYTQEQIQAALRAAVIEPTTLYEFPETYPAAIAALDSRCPM